ncbi:hypothetical protein OS493_034301 [Desmophyllum pertusum]|uniref:Uncharacterized protein n=1 Tax=Desmophyllum pertusum TaxID=174260 RepID=A0A9W9YVD6_9CNID|nr:hypothetical protein OS493_034301 [Desmophyllum pertusum]
MRWSVFGGSRLTNIQYLEFLDYYPGPSQIVIAVSKPDELYSFKTKRRYLPESTGDLECFRSQGGNCSAITPDNKVGCMVPKHTNSSVCYYLGCCWNETETNIAMKCFTKNGGTCMLYKGEVCRESLDTLPDYRDTRRFFDNKFGLPATEQFLKNTIDVINEFAKDNEKCRYILVNMLCHYTVPPCYPDNTIIDYCKGDCEAIFKECSQTLNQVIGAVKIYIKTEHLDFIHRGIPDCSKHHPLQYYESLPGNKTCIKSGFFNYTEEKMTAQPTSTPTADHDNKLSIILPIVLVGLLIIVVCAIVFVLWGRRTYLRRQESELAIMPEGFSMRDKLRAESLKSLDTLLLRHYDPNRLKQYRLDRVQYVKDLGAGSFGNVFQGRAAGLVDIQPKKEILVAVKALKDDSSKEQKNEFFREVTLMSILTHPNIVQLLAVSTEEEPYGMVFEFMSGGDLNQYLRNALPAETSLDSDETSKVYLTQEDLVSISTQIATGMQYVAQMKFLHRDLAARNCLVGDDLVVKIGDFGMSRDIYTSDYYKMTSETLLPIRWLSPEALQYGKFSIKSDVYAYGVVLWEIFTFGLQPYYGYTNKEVMDFIQKGIHLGKPDNCPDFIYALMKDCWEADPEKRLEFTGIETRLNNPFQSYDMFISASDNEEESEDVDTAPGDSGNYVIPSSPATSDYDITRATSPEGNYDVPRSSEDARINSGDDSSDEESEAPNDFAV